MSRDAFREDAPREQALAREVLMLAHRLRLLKLAKMGQAPWSAEDIDALDWMQGLAVSGHAGAQRTMQRVTGRESVLDSIHAAAPRKLEAWAGGDPAISAFLARAECRKAQPDLARLQCYLEDSPELRRHASDVGELRAAAPGPVAEQDLEVLRKYIGDIGGAGGLPYELARLLDRRDREGLLYELAKWRLAAADPAVRRVGQTLLESAAAQGLPLARAHLLRDSKGQSN